jgi:hypothetical protein
MLRNTALAATIALAASISCASAQARVEAGVLECRAGQTTGFVVGSETRLNCIFRPTAGGPVHGYTAIIRRAGLDLGVTAESGVAWGVFAPTRIIGPGDLGGVYGGVTAGATVGVGGSANVLVGGSNNSYALQPLSLGAQVGLNVAAGIAGLELRAAR